ncbi:hypothetical protein [Priestia sp. HNGD-A6]|uniref:DUF7668 domain-containing protein n=1 Tax=Priestia sp. HNGD-A6 TaxID=3092666 RepID=UPI003891CB06
MENNTKIIELVKGVVGELVQNNIASLPLEDNTETMDLREELDYYPGVMTLPPEEAYYQLDDVIYIYKQTVPHFRLGKNNLKKRFPKLLYMVDFDLYYDNERSDLTLQCNIYEDKDGEWVIKIRSIHVM